MEAKAAQLIKPKYDGTFRSLENLKKTFSSFLVYACVTVLVAIIHQLGWSWGSVLIPALWGIGSLLPLRSGEGNLLTFGLIKPQLMMSLRYFFLSSLVVFPLYVMGFLIYVRLGFFLPLTNFFNDIPVPQWLFYNFLAVALFEELFFRGFIQGRFERFAGANFRNTGAIFWIPVVVSAFLFALAHAAVYFDPLRLSVFFPALLFGWLRAKTGFLLAPILSHGTANLVSMLLLGTVS